MVMDCRGERNSCFWLEQKVGSSAFTNWERIRRDMLWGRNQEFEEGLVKREMPVSHWNGDVSETIGFKFGAQMIGVD